MRSPTIALVALFASTATAQEENKLRYYYPVASQAPKTVTADVCVYGGTPGGVAAAVQSSRMGKKAVLVVFRRHVGGMTSGGLTATDIGRAEAIGGMATEFYKRVGKQRMFLPSRAEEVFQALLKDASVPIYFEQRLKDVTKVDNRITGLTTESGVTFEAKMFVDATYEGDLFAKAGVSFHVGREGNQKYGETLNGVQFHNTHNFVVPVDPYRVEGDPKSGLLWGISPLDPGKAGDGDDKVQAYNFRMFVSHAAERLPYPKPPGYDRDRYLLLLRYLKKHPVAPIQLHVGDCNNEGGFSSDHIGANYAWPTGSYETREKIFQDHVNYQQGFMWFLANDPEVPPAIRKKVLATGLTRGEFPETGGWPHELYVREGRRMVSDYVMTEANCLSKTSADDSVGMASYNMDSHNIQRVVIGGSVRNEGDVQTRCPIPYPVSYRSITPRERECANLLVPVSLSASHIAYGSIRMEPVFMILGQSAGTAAALAIEAGVSVQKVPYAKLRDRLLADGQVLAYSGSKAALIGGIDPKTLAGITVDNPQAQLTGAWLPSSSIGPYVGADYLHDGNSGQGQKSVKYSTDLPKAGNYDVFLIWSAGPNRASNVVVEIGHADGITKATVNQKVKSGWHKVATARFEPGRQAYVVIRNDGADGHVIADAVRWLRVEK